MYAIDDGNTYYHIEITHSYEMVILSSNSGKIVIYNQDNVVVQTIQSSTLAMTATYGSNDYSLIAGGGFAH